MHPFASFLLIFIVYFSWHGKVHADHVNTALSEALRRIHLSLRESYEGSEAFIRHEHHTDLSRGTARTNLVTVESSIASQKHLFHSLLATSQTCISTTLLPQGSPCVPNLQTCHPKFICNPNTLLCEPRKNLSTLYATCTYHFECGFGKRCVDSKCQLAALHGETCKSDRECFYGQCREDGKCDERPIGSVCATSMHNQCGVKAYCSHEDNTCQRRRNNGESCRTDRECHVNGYCLDQKCRQLPNAEGQICVTQCDPINNLECLNGVCRRSRDTEPLKCAGILSPSGQCQENVPCGANNATMCNDFCDCNQCSVREETRIMEKYTNSIQTHFYNARICASKHCFGWDRRDMTRQELEAWMVNSQGCVYKSCARDFLNGGSPYCRIADEMGGNPQDYMADGYLISADEDSLCRNYTNLGFLVVIIIGFCLFICIFFIGSFLVMLMAARHIRRQEALELEAEVEMSIAQNADERTILPRILLPRPTGKQDDEFVSVFSHDEGGTMGHVVSLDSFPAGSPEKIQDSHFGSGNVTRMPYFANIQHNIAWGESTGNTFLGD